MSALSDIGVAVVGTGFIGSVHIGALRRMGVSVVGVLGSSPERGKERAAALNVPKAYASLDELLADPAVDAVHVTSPNREHYEQVKAILSAGKHVICEKPLAMTAAQSAEMVEIANASKAVSAVCYNIRFYPLNQHARQMVQSGDLGDIRLITGHYHQDWLAKPTDWNWRLEADKGGALRAVGDIGTHWLDLTTFIAGMKPVSVFAELATFLTERQKPTGPVETFSSAGAGATETQEITTDDAALILLRYPGGALGSVTVSQINVGRKNSVVWDIAGSKSSAAWDSERPDHLFIGQRDGPNGTLQRDAALMNDAGAAAAQLPGGHVEGFGDTFHALFHAVYADILAGAKRSDPPYATFADGHLEMQLCEAILKSAEENRWVEIGNGGTS